MNPSSFPSLSRFPNVKRFFTTQVDMQMEDIRGLMRLPLPEIGINGGCNFTAAAAICNIISGISTVLFVPNNPTAGSGTRFKELLETHFPWEVQDNRTANAKLLYDLVRNPLAHSLGVLRTGSIPTVISKRPLNQTEIEELETSKSRPVWVTFIVATRSNMNVISVEGMYWGIFRLLENLVGIPAQMGDAEARLS